MRLGRWLQESGLALSEAGVREGALEAQVLAAHAVGRSRSWVLAHPEAEAPDALNTLLERRLRREPLAYILGSREFYGRRFDVSPAVLIPRQETETLVDLALGQPIGPTLDLGTGSGVLAVTIKLEQPERPVTASDLSPEALAVAAANASKLGAQIDFVQSDGLDRLQGRKFDLIVSNPPYVAKGTALEPELAYEPAAALFAEGEGLAFYRRIAREAPSVIAPRGRLVVELGDGSLEPVSSLFCELGWDVLEVKVDLGGAPRALLLGRTGRDPGVARR